MQQEAHCRPCSASPATGAGIRQLLRTVFLLNQVAGPDCPVPQSGVTCPESSGLSSRRLPVPCLWLVPHCHESAQAQAWGSSPCWAHCRPLGPPGSRGEDLTWPRPPTTGAPFPPPLSWPKAFSVSTPPAAGDVLGCVLRTEGSQACPKAVHPKLLILVQGLQQEPMKPGKGSESSPASQTPPPFPHTVPTRAGEQAFGVRNTWYLRNQARLVSSLNCC